MLYTLTLTKQERRAFDWVGMGNRYNACAIARLLSTKRCPDDLEWAGDYDITFHIPECIAWQICELAEEEDNLWPCFSDELKSKLIAFTETVV